MNKTIKELAVELTIEITAVCDTIKGRAVFVNQLLRSCSSIGANSYEATYAQSTADFVNKLEIALKECYETDYWLEILFKVGSMDESTYKALANKCGAIRRKLISSITTAKDNGDCLDSDNFYPMTLLDGNEIVGHLILRFVDEERTNLRLGFVIVDDSKRGMGYGKEMLLLTIKYAFEIMKVDKVNLGVFDNNMPAYHCYKAVGFKEIKMAEPETCNICGEEWNVIELELEKADYQA